jgi:hypothetical protein
VLRTDLRDRCALVDRDSERLDGRRETLDQLDRVQPCPVRGPGRADRVGDPDALGGLPGAVQLAVLLAERQLVLVERLQPGELRGRVGHLQDAADMHVRVDVLLPGDPHDLGDGLVHRLLQPYGGLVSVQRRVPVAARDAVVEPAPVASGGAVAAELLLQHGDAQEGRGLLQVVRGPQTGVAATDDDDVGGPVPGEGLPLGGDAVVGIPEGDAAVDGAAHYAAHVPDVNS